MLTGAPGRKAIAMGTGTGQFAVHLARLGFRVTGIDISERMIQKARDTNGELPPIIYCAGEKIVIT